MTYLVKFHGSGFRPTIEVDFEVTFNARNDDEFRELVIKMMDGEEDDRIVGGPPEETGDCGGYADDVIQATDPNGKDITEQVDHWWRYGVDDE